MKNEIKSLLIATRDWVQIAINELLIRPFLFCHPRYGKKYGIVICCIFKNEARFLKEWIEFNHMIGVEHFYLYNNNSTDGYSAILRPYIESGLVTFYDFPYQQGQLKAYRHFWAHHRHETQWVSFLDVDEFFCPNSSDNLKDWLRAYERYPVVLVFWKMFGTSGMLTHDDSRLVIEQYHVSWAKLYHVGKCFINTDWEICSWDATVHHAPSVCRRVFGLTLNILPVNQFHRSTKGERFVSVACKMKCPTIQINHYWSKAWDVYAAKRSYKGDVYFAENPKKDIAYFFFHETRNCSTDFKIYRHLMRLKLRLGGIS